MRGLIIGRGADLKGSKDAVVGTSMRYRGLVFLAAGAMTVTGCRMSPVSPSAPEGISGYSAPPIPGHALAGRFGSSGTSLWLLSASGLSTSDDGGLHWSAQTLPNNVTASAIADVAQVPSRGLWIAVPDNSGVHLYRLAGGASSWTSSLLVPTWPAGAAFAGPAGAVAITPGPGSLVTVAATIPNGTDGAFSSLFTSTDDGVTFVEHAALLDSPANVAWKHVMFVSAQSGLVVVGTDSATLLHSSDGGATWSPVSLKGLPAATRYYLGNPVIAGSDVELPVIGLPSGGVGASLSLLTSHDDGLTFDGPTGSALDLGTAVNPALAYRGEVIWAVPSAGGQIFETGDRGRTWTSVNPAGLPPGVTIVSLTGPSSATALIGIVGCPGFVPNCWTSAYVVATMDGGRTWSAV